MRQKLNNFLWPEILQNNANIDKTSVNSSACSNPIFAIQECWACKFTFPRFSVVQQGLIHLSCLRTQYTRHKSLQKLVLPTTLEHKKLRNILPNIETRPLQKYIPGGQVCTYLSLMGHQGPNKYVLDSKVQWSAHYRAFQLRMINLGVSKFLCVYKKNRFSVLQLILLILKSRLGTQFVRRIILE